MHQVNPQRSQHDSNDETDISRRKFLTSLAVVSVTSVVALGVSTSTANASPKQPVKESSFTAMPQNINFPWMGP
ncbi:MAG: hypothetical protein ACI935_000397 [Moritella dasanensis]|jgi:hypothetical protein